MRRRFLILSGMALGAFTLPVHADPLNASNWVEHTFDAGGTEGTNAFGAPTQSGGSVVGAMPTDSTNWPYSAAGGGQGFEAVEHLAATSGPLVGDQSAKTGLSATFSLYDSNIATGAAFTTSDFGGELSGTGTSVEKVLLFVGSHNVVDPGNPLSEWWYSPTAANVTTMTNGGSRTLTADFSDLHGWTNISGVAADSSPSETAVFKSTLGDLTSLGLSFGSGNFYSDGFGFSTGGEGTVTLSAFSAVSAVPLPKSAWAGLALIGGLGMVSCTKRLRKQTV